MKAQYNNKEEPEEETKFKYIKKLKVLISQKIIALKNTYK